MEENNTNEEPIKYIYWWNITEKEMAIMLLFKINKGDKMRKRTQKEFNAIKALAWEEVNLAFLQYDLYEVECKLESLINQSEEY